MEDDEYAIVSKKEFLALKKEIDRLKKNPLEGSENGENLQASIDSLNMGLNTMLEVFKQAADDMKLDEHEAATVGKQLGPINEKLDTIIDQNQKIAKGLVTIADMVKEKLEELAAAPKLPPLGGGPRPIGPSIPPPVSSQPFSPPGLPPLGSPGLPPMSNQLPPLGNSGLPPLPGGLPPMPEGFEEFPPLGPGNAPPGAPKRTIMGGLMK